MFAYCNNCPVVLSDANGTFPWIIPIIILPFLLTGCESKEKSNWPDDCPYDYWGEGGGRLNDNCYGYVFDYWAWSLPGQYGYPAEQNWDPLTTDITYTIDSMIRYVEADATARGRRVEHISSPAQLPEGALLIACKLTSDGKDFHFAVMLPNNVWLDKPGAGESRYNKIDGFAKTWVIGKSIYDSATIYFAYFRE